MAAKLPHLHLRVFLASPGDVGKERKAARELMGRSEAGIDAALTTLWGEVGLARA